MNQNSSPAAGMLCPVCKVGLSLSDREGVEIDYCPQCRGVWLDRGELDKIIERSGAYENTAQPDLSGSGYGAIRGGHDRYPRDGRHGGSHRGGHAGFLGRLFDHR